MNEDLLGLGSRCWRCWVKSDIPVPLYISSATQTTHGNSSVFLIKCRSPGVMPLVVGTGNYQAPSNLAGYLRIGFSGALVKPHPPITDQAGQIPHFQPLPQPSHSYVLLALYFLTRQNPNYIAPGLPQGSSHKRLRASIPAVVSLVGKRRYTLKRVESTHYQNHAA